LVQAGVRFVSKQLLSHYLLVLPQVTLQEPDDFIKGMVLKERGDVQYLPSLIAVVDDQVILGIVYVLLCHGVHLSNHSSQCFLYEQFLHRQFCEESLGMKIPLEMPLQTSAIFFSARLKSFSVLDV